jgi:hypothetical protein
MHASGISSNSCWETEAYPANFLELEANILSGLKIKSDLSIPFVISSQARSAVNRSKMISERNLGISSGFLVQQLKCNLNATLFIDLSCDDQSVLMGRILHTKYICLSSRPETYSNNQEIFDNSSNEYFLVDIFSPDLFSSLKKASRLWNDEDVVVIHARYFFEYLDYSTIHGFLKSIKTSSADFLVSSNTLGQDWHNPVVLDKAYNEFNFYLYPFELGRSKYRIRAETVSNFAAVETWRTSDIPFYPLYADPISCPLEDSVCGRHTREDWALYVHRTQGTQFSQSGQDGALQYIFDHIGEGNKTFVEFGFNGNSYEEVFFCSSS